MKVYLGLLGSYRTFEKTQKNLYQNLIKNNPKIDFDIYINTEYEQEYIHKKWNKTELNKKYLNYDKKI